MADRETMSRANNGTSSGRLRSSDGRTKKTANTKQTSTSSDLADLAMPERGANCRAAIEGVNDARREIGERMRHLTESLSTNPSIRRIADQIAEQQRAIDAIKQPFSSHFSESKLPQIPPNPIHETNDRLASIEKRFGQMQGIATEAANIANSLQAAAAEFLVKFERAAENNDRSAARAIGLGTIAVLIALAMPVFQITYSEFWRVPNDAEAMQTIIADMKAEITELRNAQERTADRLSEALKASDNETAAVLRDIQQLLTSQQPSTGLWSNLGDEVRQRLGPRQR